MKALAERNFIWLPTVEQGLLLKAGICQDSSAISAWQAWKKLFPLKNAGEAEIRLFPFVYHNLQRLNYSDEETGALKKAHRAAYKNTRIQLRTAENLISLFRENGIESLLLKGGALGITYYDSIALRPMADLDVLIKPKDIFKAATLLESKGWSPYYKNLPSLFEIIHSCPFYDVEKKEFDLHWRLMGDCWNADKNDVFWESAVPVKYNSLTAETLCPTDHLFHVCCHGARYNPVPPIRWIADAIMILRAPAEIDWPRLYQLGQIYRLNMTLFHTLSYLKETFNPSIPKDYLDQVKQLPKTQLEKMRFRHFSEPPKAWTIGRFAQEAIFQYSIRTSSTKLKPRSLAFIKYLQHFLTIEKISKKLSSPK
jgi:hypothetical protein